MGVMVIDQFAIMLNPPFKYSEKGKSFKNETVSPWKLQSSRNSEWTHAKKKKKKRLRGFIWNEVPESAGKSKVKNPHKLTPLTIWYG